VQGWEKLVICPASFIISGISWQFCFMQDFSRTSLKKVIGFALDFDQILVRRLKLSTRSKLTYYVWFSVLHCFVCLKCILGINSSIFSFELYTVFAFSYCYNLKGSVWVTCIFSS
jgi:hypothetical protein